MAETSDADSEKDLVQCPLCEKHVWVRKDRLEMHNRRVHPATAPSKKSFSTYHAKMASSLPPKNMHQPSAQKSIILISRSGRRAGPGRCAECGLEQPALWHYSESNLGPVDICGPCKTTVFERSFGAP
jgi:hypothetical protein